MPERVNSLVRWCASKSDGRVRICVFYGRSGLVGSNHKPRILQHLLGCTYGLIMLISIYGLRPCQPVPFVTSYEIFILFS